MINLEHLTCNHYSKSHARNGKRKFVKKHLKDKNVGEFFLKKR